MTNGSEYTPSDYEIRTLREFVEFYGTNRWFYIAVVVVFATFHIATLGALLMHIGGIPLCSDGSVNVLETFWRALASVAR